MYNKFKIKAKWWKKHIYGNIDKQINDINEQLGTLKNQIRTHYDDKLHQNINNLEKHHLHLLKQKEIFWKQRSRIRWLKEGDNNTKFFHAYATNRKRRNFIQSIKVNNEWIYDQDSIKNALVNHYKNIYISNNYKSFSFSNLNNSQINNGDWEDLIAKVSEVEIWRGLKRIGPDKAPGPDGLNAHFYQKFWNYINRPITNMITEFFNTNHLDKRMNETRIVLIPKNNNPYLINHYRPISLCNVNYKIISNIIVNRIRPLLNNIISPYQNAFVPKRLITDNIALAHELLHTMSLKEPKLRTWPLKSTLRKRMIKLNGIL